MILNANHMLIRLGYDIALRLPFPTAVIYVLHVHPARKGDLVGSEDFRIEPELSVEEYFAVGFWAFDPGISAKSDRAPLAGQRPVMFPRKQRWLARPEFNRLRPPSLPEHDEPLQRGSEGEMPTPTERKPGGC